MPLRFCRLEMERILRQFGRFARLNPEEAMEWLPLCQEAALSLEDKIRRGRRLSPEAKALLESTCGAEAAYRYALALEAGEKGGSFQIGDISVREEGGRDRLRAAKQLRDEYLALAEGYLERDSPAFLSVPVSVSGPGSRPIDRPRPSCRSRRKRGKGTEREG